VNRGPPLRLVSSRRSYPEGPAEEPVPYSCAALATTHEQRVETLSWAARQLPRGEELRRRALVDLWTLSAAADSAN